MGRQLRRLIRVAPLAALVADRGLVYVKGGAAWLNSTNSVNIPNVGLGGFAGGELASKEPPLGVGRSVWA
jgi:hypothetical protein